ncbi:MAG: hypothetical protein P8M12_05905 [Flavobacteriales bacterium]|jgi:hypothetical protein|nr:hypothetical protein [Flavobacteriales bacterium]
MKKYIAYLPLLLSIMSLLFSNYLWFYGDKQQAMYVGIWVPSILCVANYFNSLKALKK